MNEKVISFPGLPAAERAEPQLGEMNATVSVSRLVFGIGGKRYEIELQVSARELPAVEPRSSVERVAPISINRRRRKERP